MYTHLYITAYVYMYIYICVFIRIKWETAYIMIANRNFDPQIARTPKRANEILA